VWRKLWSFYKNIFISQNFNRTSTSISDLTLPLSLPSQPSKNKPYTPLFLLPRGLRNPSRWITCLTFRPPRKKMIMYLWWLIIFRIWSFSQPARRVSQRHILPSSSSNRCESILKYHKPSSKIGKICSLAHHGWVSGHYWT
jgi:hypothetical protein